MSNPSLYNTGLVGIFFMIASVSQFLLGNEKSAYGLLITSVIIFFMQIVILLPTLKHEGEDEDK